MHSAPLRVSGLRDYLRLRPESTGQNLSLVPKQRISDVYTLSLEFSKMNFGTSKQPEIVLRKNKDFVPEG